MNVIGILEMLGDEPQLDPIEWEAKVDSPEVTGCQYRLGLGADGKHVICGRLEVLCGNSVSVGDRMCAACRVWGSFELVDNPELANCVIHTAFSRFFPNTDRTHLVPEIDGERDALVESLKSARGSERAKRFVDTMFLDGLFKSPEEAAEFLEKHGLVSPE